MYKNLKYIILVIILIIIIYLSNLSNILKQYYYKNSKETLTNSCNIESCYYIHPAMRRVENPYFPKKDDFKPYKNIKIPKSINIECWEAAKACCKS